MGWDVAEVWEGWSWTTATDAMLNSNWHGEHCQEMYRGLQNRGISLGMGLRWVVCVGRVGMQCMAKVFISDLKTFSTTPVLLFRTVRTLWLVDLSLSALQIINFCTYFVYDIVIFWDSCSAVRIADLPANLRKCPTMSSFEQFLQGKASHCTPKRSFSLTLKSVEMKIVSSKRVNCAYFMYLITSYLCEHDDFASKTKYNLHNLYLQWDSYTPCRPAHK